MGNETCSAFPVSAEVLRERSRAAPCLPGLDARGDSSRGRRPARPGAGFLPRAGGGVAGGRVRPRGPHSSVGSARSRVGRDGIAVSSNGTRLSSGPLTSHHGFRAHSAVLAAAWRSDADAVRTVESLGDRCFASDAMPRSVGRTIQVTEVENDAIHDRGANGTLTTAVSARLCRESTELRVLPRPAPGAEARTRTRLSRCRTT
jgi:hypothetical protein